MARIARRSLRLRGLPLFSLGEPWQSVADAGGRLSLRLFEPRYVELARRVLPPRGDGKFGYWEEGAPRAGAAGVLAQIEDFAWADGAADRGPVFVAARAARRFRILAVRGEEVAAGKPPLMVAHVQLFTDEDLMRGAGRESWDFWMREEPAAHGDGDEPKRRADSVTAGTQLMAKQGAPIFESPESWKATGMVSAGAHVIAAGSPRVVEGYLMVPIMPAGAVELTLFAETPAGHEEGVPSEDDVLAVLETIKVEGQARTSVTGDGQAHGRRKSRSKGRH